MLPSLLQTRYRDGGGKSWPVAVMGEEHRKDNAQDMRYYLVLQEERSALKEALCLLNISTASRN